jgi:quercetin dioxygenase-like cupin family protein
MALPHTESGEVIDIRPYGDAIREAQSIALFKFRQLEVIRLVFPAGYRMPGHKVSGAITLQCIEGEVEVEVNDRVTLLPAGHLMHLRPEVGHALHALKASSVLVTIVLFGPDQSPKSA